jgi:hypothetical protein
MIVVSGCPRSGTSLTMLLMSKILGEDRIKGSKWPQEQERSRGEDEPAHLYEIRKFMEAKQRAQVVKSGRDPEKYKDMNPNGFWECQYSVRGISYNYPDRAFLRTVEQEEDGNRSCVKIVSQGLLSSDPRYLSKIIYLIRHPRKVAKSQERLSRGLQLEGKDISEHVKIHTPEMYINVTVAACRFLLENPDIPVLFVNYDDLINDAARKVEDICNFIDQPFAQAWTKTATLIKPNLRRSAPEDVDNALWEDAENVYDMFNEGMFQEIIDYASDPLKPMNRSTRKWSCPRSGNVVDEKICGMCVKDRDFRDEARKAADLRRIDWKEQPCLFECGLDLDRPDAEYLTPDESIQHNSWQKDMIAYPSDAPR